METPEREIYIYSNKESERTYLKMKRKGDDVLRKIKEGKFLKPQIDFRIFGLSRERIVRKNQEEEK